MKRAIFFIAFVALFVAARGQTSYPIKLQPGIWPPEKGVVVSSTPPRSYGYATCWFYALNDINNPAAAVVYVDYLRVYALVNGKTVLVNNSDYGTGPGQQPTAAGDWTIRYNATDGTTLIDEVPGVVADGWTATYMITQPTNHPAYATQLWNDTPQQVPATPRRCGSRPDCLCKEAHCVRSASIGTTARAYTAETAASAGSRSSPALIGKWWISANSDRGRHVGRTEDR